MPAFQDITGQKFYNLTALSPTEERRCGAVVWLWKCDCGETTKCRAALVRDGHTKSCGCLFHKEHRERTEPQTCRHCGGISTRKTQTTGLYTCVCDTCANKQGNWSRDLANQILVSARGRARRNNLPFNLEIEDIIIPTHCPVLGIELGRNNVKYRDNSPSLDKLIPDLGYVKGNVAVISWRANRFKSDGTLDEIRRIADWMESQLTVNDEVMA